MDNSEPIFTEGADLESGSSSVKNCARCQGAHPITFRKFKNNKVPGYDYWAMCPDVNEPILIKVTKDEPEIS